MFGPPLLFGPFFLQLLPLPLTLQCLFPLLDVQFFRAAAAVGTLPEQPEAVDLPPEPSAAPLRRWSHYNLEDSFWGACYLGDTGKLPENLVGRSIQITTRRGDSWTTSVLEVLQHEADSVVVRDSGKPSSAS